MPDTKVRDGGGGGKWRLDADGDICSADGRLVACPCYDEDVWAIEEARRNARLIAAAPAMAEALAECVALMHADNPADGWADAIAAARAALALAEGDQP